MDWSELQHATPNELQRQLGELRERLRGLRFRLSVGQEKDVREVRDVRRHIARILTKLRQLKTTTENKV